MTQTFYKIVDVINGEMKTLYHGNNGTKTLQPKKWLKSQQRIAKKYGYITGWNIIPTHEECIEYLKLFKKLENKEIVKCQARGVWKKPTNNNKATRNLTPIEYTNNIDTLIKLFSSADEKRKLVVGE